jgi:hypothetical protein
MKKNVGIITAIFFIVLPSRLSFTSELSDLEEKTKEAFILIEETWRLPKDKQPERIVKIYKEAIPSIYFIPFANLYTVSEVPENLPPAELANWFLKEHGLSQFLIYIKRRGLNLLEKNILETKRLIRNDLDLGPDKEKERALLYISVFKLNEYEKDVADIFLHSTRLELRAAYAMRDLQMYDGIKLLVSKPENPTEYFEILRSLQKNRKAHNSIISLLDSPDSEIRWKAAYSLSESGDEDLILQRHKGSRI